MIIPLFKKGSLVRIHYTKNCKNIIGVVLDRELIFKSYYYDVFCFAPQCNDNSHGDFHYLREDHVPEQLMFKICF